MQVEMCSENHQLEDTYICPKLVSNKLDQSIINIIEKTGFIKYNIEKKCVSTNGGNYLGILYEIDVKGKTEDGSKELNIFVKSVIPGQNDLQIISVPDVYKTEVFTYKELSKMFEQLQEDAQVPLHERYKMVKCYDESNTEVIIMENLSRQGFTTAHRMDVVTLKFAEMAITELAKFHALSFVIKENRPEFFEEKIKTIKTAYNNGEQWHGFVESIIKIAINDIDGDDKKRVERFCEGLAHRFMRNYEDESIKRCLCHGDYRPNNILTKIMDGEVLELIPVDYQLMHYGCPVLDIFYFIFCCTDQQFRRAHLSHLKDLYHESLTKFLKYFDLDVNLYYPREEFDREYTDMLEQGLMYAILFLPFVFASEDDVPDVTKDEMTALSFKVDEKFKERIRGIVEDYTEWGVI